MANSALPETARFAEQLTKLCDQPPRFLIQHRQQQLQLRPHHPQKFRIRAHTRILPRDTPETQIISECLLFDKDPPRSRYVGLTSRSWCGVYQAVPCPAAQAAAAAYTDCYQLTTQRVRLAA